MSEVKAWHRLAAADWHEHRSRDARGNNLSRVIASHDPGSDAAKCVWSEDSDGNWDTMCGEMFTFTADGPVENGMRFCCYCGSRLIEKEYEEKEDAE